MDSSIPLEARQRHGKLFIDLDSAIAEKTNDFDRVKTVTGAHLAQGDINRCKNILQLLRMLQKRGRIGVGKYDVLKQILDSAGLIAVREIVAKAENEVSLIIETENIDTDEDLSKGAEGLDIQPGGHQAVQGTGEAANIPGPQQINPILPDAVAQIKWKSDQYRVLCEKKIQACLGEFVKTTPYQEARDSIEGNMAVLLVGGSGDGKSTIVHFIAANPMSEYLPICITSPKEIQKYTDIVWNTEIKLLFIFDDVVGGSYVMHHKVDEWVSLGNSLEMYLGKHKFLLATRATVWQHCEVQLKKIPFFSNIVEISSAKLTIGDKTKLLEKSLGSSKHLTSTQQEQIIKNKKPIAYNQCCRLVREAINTGKLGTEIVRIFEKPFSFLELELKTMRDVKRERVKYATLCLIMLCGGGLKCRELTGTMSEVTQDVRERFDAVLQACGCPGQTTGNLLESAKKLCGTFLEKLHKTGEGSTYTFSHDSIREAVTMLYGASHFRQCLKFLPRDVIVKISHPHRYEKHEHEFVVCVSDDVENIKELVTVFTEAAIIGDWCLHDVFKNPFVREKNFQQVWVEYLKSDRDKQTAFIESKSWDGQCVDCLSLRSGALTLCRFLCDDLHVQCSCQRDYNSPLCLAVEDDDKQTVINLMSSHKQTDSQIREAFTIACRRGRTDLSDLLLQGMNNDRARDDTIVTGLERACMCGHRETVQHLLQKYDSPCRRLCTEGLTMASFNGQTDIVRLLLSHGTDVNSIGKVGYTGLHCAAYEGHPEVVQILLQHRPNIHLRNIHNQTALDYAKQFGHTAIVDLLVKHGQDGN